MERVLRQNVALLIGDRALRRAVREAQALVSTRPDAENYYWSGEAFRALGPWADRAELYEEQVRVSLEKRLRKPPTPEEIEAALLDTPEGRAVCLKHHQLAEDAFRKALEANPGMMKAHRGLGLLYEKAQKSELALESFRKYLAGEIMPPDRKYIERRIQILEQTVPREP
jgi:tetratricopeptide (TPR) repeat protein